MMLINVNPLFCSELIQGGGGRALSSTTGAAPACLAGEVYLHLRESSTEAVQRENLLHRQIHLKKRFSPIVLLNQGVHCGTLWSSRL